MERPEDWEIFWKASEEIEFNYHLEVEKSKSLVGDLGQTRVRMQNLEALLHQEREAHQATKKQLSRVQPTYERLKALAIQIRNENQKIHQVYPIQDLWAAKQIEIDRLKKSWEALPKNHSDRNSILALIEAHEQQRDELKWLLDDAEHRFEEQIKRLDQFESDLEAQFPQQRQVQSQAAPQSQLQSQVPAGKSIKNPVPEF